MEPTLTARDREAFIRWLSNSGATILPPKVANEYVRFQKPTGKQHTIMQTKTGDAYVNGGKLELLVRDFLHGLPKARWDADKEAVSYAVSVLHKRKVNLLASRDGGMRCVYCGKTLTHGTATLEHVVPKSKNGPDNIHNLVLACSSCNTLVGNMSVSEKVRLMQKVVGTYRQSQKKSVPHAVQEQFPNARIIQKPGCLSERVKNFIWLGAVSFLLAAIVCVFEVLNV